MAMRIMNKNEFEQQLKNVGLKPTRKTSKKGRLWEGVDGQSVMVPKIGKNGIPDFIADRVLEEVNRLYY